MSVFSSDNSRPRSFKNSTIIGFTPFSRISGFSPVTMKSSANLTKLTLGEYALPFIFVLWYLLSSLVSSPSSTMLQITGEMAEPCGAPFLVGNSLPVSIYPLLSHFFSNTLSIGILFIIHSWLMLSKHPLISPSSIHSGDLPFARSVKHCSIASCGQRFGLNPKEFLSAVVSAIGSSANLYKVCMARSFIIGILNGLFLPFFFGMYILLNG